MELEQAVEGFLLNLAVEGRSANYITWCRHILKVVQCWIGPRRINEIAVADIRSYIRYLQTEHIPYGEGHPLHQRDRRLSPKTIRAHWAVLSILFS